MIFRTTAVVLLILQKSNTPAVVTHRPPLLNTMLIKRQPILLFIVAGLGLMAQSLCAQVVHLTSVETYQTGDASGPILTRRDRVHLQIDANLPTSWKSPTIRLFRNGKPFLPDSQKGAFTVTTIDQNHFQFTQEVSLLRDDNTWVAEIKSAEGNTKLSQPLRIIHKPGKPNLHLLCVGVPYNLTYTQRDAAALFAYFKTQEGRLFGKVNGQVLVCDEETRYSKLGQTITNLRNEELCHEDVLIVSFSGHGKASSAFGPLDFGLVTNDASKDVQDDRYVLFFYQKDIIENLNKLSCKRLILLDACHSGAADGNKDWIGNLAQAQSILDSTPSGIVTLVSSTRDESSYESGYWKHGAFTKAILDGLLGKANKVDASTGKADNFITVLELAEYVKESVPPMVYDLLHRPQHPQLKPEHGPEEDYPIFVIPSHSEQEIAFSVPSCLTPSPPRDPPLKPERPKPENIAVVGLDACDIKDLFTTKAVSCLKKVWPDKTIFIGQLDVRKLAKDGTLCTILDGQPPEKSLNVNADQLVVITCRETKSEPKPGFGANGWIVRTMVRFDFINVKTPTDVSTQVFEAIGVGETIEQALSQAIESAIDKLVK